MVIVFHIGLITKLHGIPGLFASYGAYGVQLFFIVSGFTIYLTLDSYSENVGGGVRHFYIRRCIRIFPIYWLGILVYTVTYGWNSHWLLPGPEPLDYLFHILLLNSFLPGGTSSVVPGGWSISVEVVFYAVAPMLFAFSKTMRQTLIVSLFLLLLGPLATHILSSLINFSSLDEGEITRFWYRFF